VSLHLYPFMPTTAETIWSRLGLSGSLADARLATAGRWGSAAERPARPGDALFPRVEPQREQSQPAAAPGTPTPAAPASGTVTLEEFQRLDLRVAEIREATAVPGSKKLVQLRVAVGLEERTIVAGIRLDYPPAELVGKQIVVVANLQPTRLMGVESRGMLLAGTDADGKLVLVTPERRAAVGAKVK
jgi:methionyl-tRNA synthetase